MNINTIHGIAIGSTLLFIGVAILFWIWTYKIEEVKVPAHISLDTAKYKILKEDSLTLEGMKIKRVYYLIRKEK